MADSNRDEAAVEAIARAMVKGWPARIVDKAAPGWAQVLLVAPAHFAELAGEGQP